MSSFVFARFAKPQQKAQEKNQMSTTLSGHQIRQSEAIDKQIAQLVQQAQGMNESINGIRGPLKEHQAEAKRIMDEIGVNRGRELYYPYTGTGAGKGALVELEDGSIKLDLINGIGIHILGHSHPEVMRASLKASLSDIMIQGNLQMNREYHEMGKLLVNLAKKKSRLQHVWITTCGTMANEIALKISRQKKAPARMVLAMRDAFAGRSTMMTEIGDNPAHGVGQPKYNEVLRLPFYDGKDPQSGEKTLRQLKEHVAKHEGNISALVFEPIQGEGGFRVAPREFFVPMLEFCKEKGIAIWLDEVQTFCRTGEFFAFETLDLGKYVDIVSIAKTAQVAATLYTAEYNPQPGLIAGTFAGATPALASGRAILELLANGGYMGAGGRIRKIHEKFVSVFGKLISGSCKGILDDVGGIGLMVAVTPFGGDKDKVNQLLKVLYKNGLIAFSCGHGPYRLRFLVPATITDKEIELAGEILEKSMLEMK